MAGNAKHHDGRGRICITRRIGEAILIGDDVEVHVLATQPARLSLLVIAPKSVSVVRKELSRQAANQQAADPRPHRVRRRRMRYRRSRA